MNPIFGRNPMINGFQKMQQIMNDIRMLQQNPSQIGQYLADRGVISQDQIADVSNMNFQQAGQYLIQIGKMPQQQVQQLSQVIPSIQNNMR